MRAYLIATLALVLWLAAGGLLLADGIERPREVLGAGATDSSAPAVSLRATLGEPVVGRVSGGGVVLGQGFWHGGASRYSVYLPLVLRH